MRDNLAAVQQLGFDPDRVAKDQAQKDKINSFSLLDFHTDNRAATAAGDQAKTDASPTITLAANALRLCFSQSGLDALQDVYDFRVAAQFPGDVSLYGPDQIETWRNSFLAALPDLKLSIDHVAEIPEALLSAQLPFAVGDGGTHAGAGCYGAPSESPVYMLGVSHFRMMNARVREQVTVWDDIALRRQIATARYQSG